SAGEKGHPDLGPGDAARNRGRQGQRTVPPRRNAAMTPGRSRAALIYTAMVISAVAVFLLIDRFGRTLEAPVAEAPIVRDVAGGKPDALAHVLVALTAVMVTGLLLGRLFRAIGQPAVIGEGGPRIPLGPSLPGRVWPGAARFILPPEVAPSLGVVAQLGVILYMFLVGLELNPAVLRERARAAVAIAHTSIVAPFLLGSALALVLYPHLAGRDVPF